MPIHHLGRDAGGGGIIELMHDGALAVEHPMLSARTLDPAASFGAGDDQGGAKNSLGLLCLDRETRAVAHGQANRVTEQAAQTLVGQRPEAFVINRQGMKARPERRGRRYGLPADGCAVRSRALNPQDTRSRGFFLGHRRRL